MMRFRVTRTARRHRIGNAHILAAIRDAGVPTVVHTTLGPQLHYVGLDDRGVELHVIAVPDDRHDDSLAIIHAQPASDRPPPPPRAAPEGGDAP